MRTENLPKVVILILILSVIGAILYGMCYFLGYWITIGYVVCMSIILAFIAEDIRKTIEKNETY